MKVNKINKCGIVLINWNLVIFNYKKVDYWYGEKICLFEGIDW